MRSKQKLWDEREKIRVKLVNIFRSDINGDGIYVCSDFRKCSATPNVNWKEKCENEIDAQVKGWFRLGAALNNELAASDFLSRTVPIRIIAENSNLPNLRNFVSFQETIASITIFHDEQYEFRVRTLFSFSLLLLAQIEYIYIYSTWCLCFASTLVLKRFVMQMSPLISSSPPQTRSIRTK